MTRNERDKINAQVCVSVEKRAKEARDYYKRTDPKYERKIVTLMRGKVRSFVDSSEWAPIDTAKMMPIANIPNDVKRCKVCNTEFKAKGLKVYCCLGCQYRNTYAKNPRQGTVVGHISRRLEKSKQRAIDFAKATGNYTEEFKTWLDNLDNESRSDALPPCPRCGNEVKYNPHIDFKKYCSKRCRLRAKWAKQRQRKRALKVKEPLIQAKDLHCARCGQSFKPHPIPNAIKKYCSKRCCVITHVKKYHAKHLEKGRAYAREYQRRKREAKRAQTVASQTLNIEQVHK